MGEEWAKYHGPQQRTGESSKTAARRSSESVQQKFECHCLSVIKKGNGWKVKGVLFPPNPVCVFTYDFFKKSVTAITAMETEGIIRNVWTRGPYRTDLYMQSRLRVSWGPLDRVDTITQLRFVDDSKYQFKAKDALYKKHDLDQNPLSDRHFTVGTNVTFSLALRIRAGEVSSKRRSTQRITVQTWNVKAVESREKVDLQKIKRERRRKRQKIKDAVEP